MITKLRGVQPGGCMKTIALIIFVAICTLLKVSETDPFSVKSNAVNYLPIKEVKASNGLELNMNYRINLSPRLPSVLLVRYASLAQENCAELRVYYETLSQDCLFFEK